MLELIYMHIREKHSSASKDPLSVRISTPTTKCLCWLAPNDTPFVCVCCRGKVWAEPWRCEGLAHWQVGTHFKAVQGKSDRARRSWSDPLPCKPVSLFLVSSLFFLIPDPQNPTPACPGSLTEAIALDFLRLICLWYCSDFLSSSKLAITEQILNYQNLSIQMTRDPFLSLPVTSSHSTS